MTDTTQEVTAWIAERDKCNMGAFVNDVRTLVAQNVETMNVLCQEKGRTRFRYEPRQEHPPYFLIKQQLRASLRYCEFEYDDAGQRVAVTMVGPDRTYTLQTRWDTEALACRVVVTRPSNDESDVVEFPHADLWKAIQHILDPFFFPPPSRPVTP